MRVRLSFSFFAALLTVTGTVSAKPSISMDVVAPNFVNGVDNLSVTAIVKNTGTEKLKLLKDPRGVLSTDRTHKFWINGDNGPPAFTGIAFNYSAILSSPEYIVSRNSLQDFVVLLPGESISLKHDLAGVYNFTSVGAGEFKLSAFNLFQHIDSDGELATVEVATQASRVNVSGQLASSKFGTSRSLKKRIGYVGCTSSRQAIISTAANSADSLVASSSSYLSGITSGTQRYTTWFGTYTQTRAVVVRSHYANMGTDATSTTYDCTCTDSSTAAYGYPDSPGYIYLCEGFWTAPNSGTDSKPGIIIFAQVHFTANGGANDYVYGQTAAKSLAANKPAVAITSACSYEYFAENTPPLP
ncbi:deuterolysin M35 metalloprotease [Ceratobasidium sp. AG-I]|nr:deuterolysin M35 metalloprotease [Ceratobasidium sp. AG-I]